MPPTALHLPFDGGPVRRTPYVPVLLDRPGERRALGRCDDATWAVMTPFVSVARHGDPPTRGALRGRAKALRVAVGHHRFYVGLEGIAPCRRIPTPQGERETLAVLYEELVRLSLAFVPVVRTTDRPRHVDLVADAAAEHGRGLGLRHPLGTRLRRTGETMADRLLRTTESLGAVPEDIDVILDLGWLDPDAARSPRWVARQVDGLAAREAWRSITLAATCVPLSVSDVAGLDASGSIGRSDWRLWQDVTPRTDVDVRFADYAVQHPKVPRKGGRTYGNIRYTTPDELFVSRGHLLNDMDDGDLADMCRRVTAGPFSGKHFSWGDEQIHMLAQRRRTPHLAIFDEHEDDEPTDGVHGHAFWRAVGTSHHLALVASQHTERAACEPQDVAGRPSSTMSIAERPGVAGRSRRA